MANSMRKEDFDFYERIGSGGYGSVYRVADKKTNRMMAMKINSQGKFCDALEREAKYIGKFQHHCIIELLGYIDLPNEYNGLVLELMTAGNIVDAKVKVVKKGKSFPAPLRLRWNYELASALEFLHRNKVVHKDIKGSNALLNENLHAKLCDFNLGTTDTTHFENKAVTRTHCPPEVFEKAYLAAGFRTECDIYSFGILMYEVLSDERFAYDEDLCRKVAALTELVINGHRPDDSKIPNRTNDIVCASINVMKKCWQTDPTQRPGASDLLASLQNIYWPVREAAQKDVAEYYPLAKMVFGEQKATDHEEFCKTLIQTHFQRDGIHYPLINHDDGTPKKRKFVPLTTEQAKDQLDLMKNRIDLKGKEKKILSDNALRAVADQIGVEDFRRIGGCLLFTPPELDAIKYDHERYGLQEMNYQMLWKWLVTRGSSATYDWLTTACLSLKRHDLIKILCEF